MNMNECDHIIAYYASGKLNTSNVTGFHMLMTLVNDEMARGKWARCYRHFTVFQAFPSVIFFFLNDRFTNDGFECHILLYNVDNLCI